MKYPLGLRVALLACIFAVIVRAADSTPEPGFTALFNGKDLTGWQHKDGPPLDGKTDAGDGRWTIKDGILEANSTKERVLLWTARDLPKDFVLRLEFRAAVRTDSGLFFNTVQLQCGDFQTYAYKQLKAFKPQDWNTMEVTVKDGTALCTCNGELLEAALKIPEPCQLALEAGRNQIEYRNIRIKERDLPADAQGAPRGPQPRPLNAQNVRPAITHKDQIGTMNIGPVDVDAKWSSYGQYLQKMIEGIQVRWDNLIRESPKYPKPGSRVTVTFSMDSTGRIASIGKVDGDAGDLAANWCIAAISPGEGFSYGAWFDEMVATLGKSQDLTFTFLYR